MEIYKFKFEVVTPMFIGGASPNGEAEIRPPSIKGMLRWWFRALGGSKEKEEEIFGSTGSKSKIRIQIKDSNIQTKAPRSETFPPQLAYLGYGPIGWDKSTRTMQNTRPFIDVKSSFLIEIGLNTTSVEIQKNILLSLWALTHFGGLGSRNRRGFGSIKVTSINGIPDFLKWSFNTAEEFQKYLNEEFFTLVKESFGSILAREPEYTRFSKRSKIILSNGFLGWEEALKAIGNAMSNFRNRRYYADIKRLMQIAEKDVNGLISDPNYSIQNIPPHLLPSDRRNKLYNTAVPKAIFGLPNNYMSRSRRDKKYPWQVSVEALLGSEDITRRSSPLLISVTRWENGKYSWVITYLPAKFLPDGSMLKLGFPKKGLPNNKVLQQTLSQVKVEADIPSYQLIEDFLNELKKSNTLEVPL